MNRVRPPRHRLQAALLITCAWILLLATHAPPALSQDAASPEIRTLTIDGVINPLTARYLAREIKAAQNAGAAAVIVRLDTPGGVESSMRRMVESILGARVPVVVFVAPPGARATSAGMFLVLSAHVAAMASGTNMGAAHPVALGAAQPDTTLIAKAVSDAAAFARALAERRGRNAGWAELAVRRSVSVTAGAALERDVIDVIADDTQSLLRQLDNRQVTTAAGPVVMRTADARLVARPMSLPERLLHVITDPNIAYLLLTIGFLGILAELSHPGLIFPGVTGVICLVLAFVALGSLPVNWGGVLLLVLGITLFIADLFVAGLGVLAVGGVIAFVLGSLTLYSATPALPDVRVSPWLIAGVASGTAVLVLLVGRALLRARRRRVAIGAPALVGRIGIAESELAPQGTVRVDSEVWSAIVADHATIRRGESVEVVALEGVMLRVRPRREKTTRTAEEV